MKLSPQLSAYLDSIRFIAALAVLLEHMRLAGFELAWMPLSFLSHEAVIVFFVMSGFIISTSVSGGKIDGRAYWVARSSRILSVAVPSIAFCLILTALLGWWIPGRTAQVDFYREFSWLDLLGSLLFINESWAKFRGFETQLSLNGPYWSLCYEVWYYVLFGIFVFVRSSWRWPLLVLAALIAGIELLLLFPIWCLGAWLAAKWSDFPKPTPKQASVLFWASILSIAVIKLPGLDVALKNVLHSNLPGYWRLASSQRFLTDHLIGLAIAANLFAFAHLGGVYGNWFASRRAMWAALAGFSFTLYLFHLPILSLVRLISGDTLMGPASSALVAIVILVICGLVSFVTERQLPRWRLWMQRLAGIQYPNTSASR